MSSTRVLVLPYYELRIHHAPRYRRWEATRTLPNEAPVFLNQSKPCVSSLRQSLVRSSINLMPFQPFEQSTSQTSTE
ncbi:hypothetical protein RvY_08467 [Ramazzottius varieornatus]|uniref:Uncharacterized protein n=1 Tax=Ramazzottius varieornatus TaxID=947166 RepID=A0A1D1V614_RAMVA|nr:hypothetical protein RvY_08467 [Ramazzottius varieornatus]